MLTRHQNRHRLPIMNAKPSNVRTRHTGRPRSSALTRPEQLRLAKQSQRDRERQSGFVEARLKLPGAIALRLAFAARQDGFVASLATFLQDEIIEIAAFPQLHLLCWNRHTRFITAADAWSLYERNQRFVDPATMIEEERSLLHALSQRFGGGLPLG